MPWLLASFYWYLQARWPWICITSNQSTLSACLKYHKCNPGWSRYKDAAAGDHFRSDIAGNELQRAGVGACSAGIDGEVSPSSICISCIQPGRGFFFPHISFQLSKKNLWQNEYSGYPLFLAGHNPQHKYDDKQVYIQRRALRIVTTSKTRQGGIGIPST